MKTLSIRWQRLVADGQTCPRCGATEEAVEDAVSTLRKSLAPLGIEIALEKAELTVAEFKRSPLASNEILIDGRSLESWIGGGTGQSPCCDVCGPSDCRTLEVGGEVHEAIPSGLIVKAGLLAGAQLLLDKPVGTCCPPADPQKGNSGCCPPS